MSGMGWALASCRDPTGAGARTVAGQDQNESVLNLLLTHSLRKLGGDACCCEMPPTFPGLHKALQLSCQLLSVPSTASDGADPQPVPGDVAYVDAMMAKRICPGGP